MSKLFVPMEELLSNDVACQQQVCACWAENVVYEALTLS